MTERTIDLLRAGNIKPVTDGKWFRAKVWVEETAFNTLYITTTANGVLKCSMYYNVGNSSVGDNAHVIETKDRKYKLFGTALLLATDDIVYNISTTNGVTAKHANIQNMFDNVMYAKDTLPELQYLMSCFVGARTVSSKTKVRDLLVK